MKQPQHMLLQTISRSLGTNPAAVNADATFKDDLGLADWELILLINQLERRYNIQFADAEIDSIKTIQSLVQRVMRLRKQQEQYNWS
jgi:acyl carrier protein